MRPGLGGQRRRAGADAGVRLLQGSDRGSTETRARVKRRRSVRPETMVLLRRIGVILLIGAAFVAPPALAASGRLVVDEVRITGLELLNANSISDLTGIKEGDSLLGIDLHATERLIESQPFIERAKVSIAIPGELRVEIRETPLLLRWRRGASTVLLSGTGKVLGPVDSPLLSVLGAGRAASVPLVEDQSTLLFPSIGEEISALDLDIVTRLASLAPSDLGSDVDRITIQRDPQYGYVLRGEGSGFSWNAVFGIYSATIRPVEMLPAQVRLLRSLLRDREREIGWVILADGQAGTFTDPGVRPPPPPPPSESPVPLAP